MKKYNYASKYKHSFFSFKNIKNITHGIHTLFDVKWINPTIEKYNHLSCKSCRSFSECQKKKNVKKDTRYCQWSINRFEKRKQTNSRICKTCTEDCEFAGIVEMVSFCHKEKQVSEHRDMEGV